MKIVNSQFCPGEITFLWRPFFKWIMLSIKFVVSQLTIKVKRESQIKSCLFYSLFRWQDLSNLRSARSVCWLPWENPKKFKKNIKKWLMRVSASEKEVIIFTIETVCRFRCLRYSVLVPQISVIGLLALCSTLPVLARA